jgi:hypothetical protein
MDYREMTLLAGDPARVRATAKFIIAVERDDARSRMHAFLADLCKYDGSKPLTVRQLETLFSLRERASRRSRAGRYRATSLIRRAWENRLDLIDDDDAEQWLTELLRRGPDAALTRGEWLRLLALCRRLDIIDRDEWVHLS